jgi:hypothetical protein
MTMSLLPNAKAIVLCDEIIRDAVSEAVALNGVRSTIHADAFPFRQRQLCVYLELTGHRGRASTSVVAVEASTEQDVFSSPSHTLTLPGPLTVLPVIFCLRNCPFPEAGYTGFSFSATKCWWWSID